MGHRLHGEQEGRHFHGYYGDYLYLPLYIFAGTIPLWAQLRTADQDAAAGVVEALAKVVAAIRERLPQVRIIVAGTVASAGTSSWFGVRRNRSLLLSGPGQELGAGGTSGRRADDGAHPPLPVWGACGASH